MCQNDWKHTNGSPSLDRDVNFFLGNALFDRPSPCVSREPSYLDYNPLINHLMCKKCNVRNHSSIVHSVTSIKDLMEKRLASIVDRPWARQLCAMKPAFSSAKQIASSPSFQFQLGIFSRWAFITWKLERSETQKTVYMSHISFGTDNINTTLMSAWTGNWVSIKTGNWGKLAWLYAVVLKSNIQDNKSPLINMIYLN